MLSFKALMPALNTALSRISLAVLSGLLLFMAAMPAAAGEPPPFRASVAMSHGRPTFFLNDRPLSPLVYALTDVPGGRWTWEELPRHNISNFCAAGIRLFQVDLWLEQLWSADGKLDISPARRQIAGVRDVCPDAGVILRFHVTAPRWWRQRHPEEWVQYAETGYEEEDTTGLLRILEDDNYAVRRVSLASELWKQESGEVVRKILRALAAAPEGNALAGIQVADGIYGEWHNWGFYRHEPDTSGPMTRAFRVWLKGRYGTERELRRAWNQPEVTLETVRAPGMRERQTRSGIVRDPAEERKVIDYYTCMHQVVADRILFYARLIKETWPRPIVTGTFYGYYFSTFGRQAAGGHLELMRILDSPYIDYLAGPQAYEPESTKPGDPYRSRSLTTTVRIHGKLWLDEMDNEPTIPIPRDTRYDLLLRNGIANVRRNLLFTYTKGMGLWFYDFGVGGVDLDGFRYNQRGSRGSWDHPAIMKEIASLRRLFDARMQEEYRSEADVLFVYDTESVYHTASLLKSDPVTGVLIDYNTLNAFKSGVVFDPVHVDDLERIDLSPYRVIVFGNTFLLNDRQRRYIKESVAKDGRTLVWFFAPGYSDGNSLSVQHVSEVTGITLKSASVPAPPSIELRFERDSTAGYRISETPVAPLFAVHDAQAETFGRYTGSGEVAVARKRLPGSTSWFVGLPNKGIEPMRQILKRSGAHRYCSKGEIVYAGGGILAVHTSEGGQHTVTLRNGKLLTFDLPDGASTLVIDSSTGELLLPIQ
jgi:hypothetical protein